MKNALHILCLLTLVIFSACKKDDTKKADNELVGDWKFTALSCSDGAQQVSSNGLSLSQMFTLEGKDFDRTVSLKSDGTYTSSGDFTVIMTQTVNGITQQFETDIADALLTEGTYEVNGNLLTTNDSAGETSTAEFTINGNELELKQVIDMTDVVAVPGGSATTTTTGTFYSTLEKQ